MNSYCTDGFWDQFYALPEAVQKEARKAYGLWQSNPSSPGLQFKRVKSKRDWWSIRVTGSHRALCIKSGTDFMWFFIGNHDDYDDLIR